jgi:hypothetical protein
MNEVSQLAKKFPAFYGILKFITSLLNTATDSIQKEAYSINMLALFISDAFLISSFHLRFGQVLSLNFDRNTEYPEVYRSSPQFPHVNIETVPSTSLVLTVQLLLVPGCE